MTDFNTEYRLRTMTRALEQIATGEIRGEPNNHEDTLSVCRQIARKALAEVRPDKAEDK